jgi:uncharacterized protein YbcI
MSKPLDAGDAQALIKNDWTGDVDIERPGSVLAAISNAMVGLKKRHYGKGPERARTYTGDTYVFCVLEGGLTKNEETLLAAGQDDAVRNYRLLFQEVVGEATTTAIEKITGRQVLTYHSQVVFRPARAFEIFVLDAPLRLDTN